MGLRFPSARADAIRLEGILANAGDLDLAARGGPTGYWGLAQDAALRGYQKRNALGVDGWAGPAGETIAHMRDAFGPLLGGHDVPTPDDVDTHHADIAAGGPGLIALVPRLARTALAGLPDIGEAGRASNAAQIDWLTGHRTGFAGVPEQLARYVREQGDMGLAQAHDFLDRFGQRRPSEADALLAGLFGALPPVAVRPQPDRRTLELRREEMEPKPGDISDLVHRREDDEKPNIRMFAAEDAGNDPQGAQVPAQAPNFDNPPAYRAAVFAAQPGVWDAMRAQVGADPDLGDGEREKGTWPAELDHVKTPADLKPEDVKPAYRHYFDQAFPKIGGAGALDRIGDPGMASAVADTLVRSGPGKGTEFVQDAASKSGISIAPDGVFGSRTLDALKEIAGSEDRTQAFLDLLADRRGSSGFESEKSRFDYLRKR